MHIECKKCLTVYSKLQSGEINASILLTLRSILYIFLSDAINNENIGVLFKEWMSKIAFSTYLMP